MRREGERLYERLAKEYLDVPEPQAGTMGKLAALKLAALREPPAVGRRDPAPGGKCLGRGRDRLVDIGLAGLGDVGNFRVVVRIEDFDSAARLRVDEFTRDE